MVTTVPVAAIHDDLTAEADLVAILTTPLDMEEEEGEALAEEEIDLHHCLQIHRVHQHLLVVFRSATITSRESM